MQGEERERRGQRREESGGGGGGRSSPAPRASMERSSRGLFVSTLNKRKDRPTNDEAHKHAYLLAALFPS